MIVNDAVKFLVGRIVARSKIVHKNPMSCADFDIEDELVCLDQSSGSWYCRRKMDSDVTIADMFDSIETVNGDIIVSGSAGSGSSSINPDALCEILDSLNCHYWVYGVEDVIANCVRIRGIWGVGVGAVEGVNVDSERGLFYDGSSIGICDW